MKPPTAAQMGDTSAGGVPMRQRRQVRAASTRPRVRLGCPTIFTRVTDWTRTYGSSPRTGRDYLDQPSCVVRWTEPHYMEYMNMKPLKLAAFSVVALAFGYVQAQETSPATQVTSPTVSSTDSFGGVPATTSETGMSMGKTRAQVYQEYLRARQSGELDRINAQYGGQ